MYMGVGKQLSRLEKENDFAPVIRDFKKVIDKNINNEALFLAKQMFAMKLMVKMYPGLLKEDDVFSYQESELNKNQLDALHYATELLVSTGNPNADLIAVNVFHLSDTISETQVQNLAARAQENAMKWYDQDFLCDNCQRGRDAKARAVRKGISELKQLKERTIN